MEEHHLSTVAFPCISTGIYGFPNEPAAEIALNTVKSWIEKNPDKITRVIFCVFLETDFAIYKKKMSQVFQDNDMEFTEEQVKGGNTPSSEQSEDRDKDEDSDEEVDNVAVEHADVEMQSQKQDVDSEQPKQGQDEDETDNQAIDDEKCKEEKGINSDEDKTIDNNKGKDDVKEEEEQQPAAQSEEDNTQMSTVEMEEDMQGRVMSSQEVDSVPSDSLQSKDPVEKKE
ncbi:ADP-ribose glycohydrolase MACROD2 [Thalassophryne amazonica]|uniref:ADP-ribose glycohydrolase MACROD2 n=1 Tax=Thalassophryne amazonica TaxID=390379 RepID=UPI001471A26A|nr:ADP-ribose glycohydrolase MACROD2 [Thalassophryne amazonica]